MNDTYWEHEQHIKGEEGKRVPFWRNMKTCSTCYSEHKRIIEKGKPSHLGRGWEYDVSDYKIV